MKTAREVAHEHCKEESAAGDWCAYSGKYLADRPHSYACDRLTAAIEERDRALTATGPGSGAGDGLRERLAAYSHGAWSQWMAYMFKLLPAGDAGSLTIPVDKVNRWARQMNTDYSELPEREKDSDRAEADKMLAMLGAAPQTDRRAAPACSPGCQTHSACRATAEMIRLGRWAMTGAVPPYPAGDPPATPPSGSPPATCDGCNTVFASLPTGACPTCGQPAKPLVRPPESPDGSRGTR